MMHNLLALAIGLLLMVGMGGLFIGFLYAFDRYKHMRTWGTTLGLALLLIIAYLVGSAILGGR